MSRKSCYENNKVSHEVITLDTFGMHNFECIWDNRPHTLENRLSKNTQYYGMSIQSIINVVSTVIL